jgi:hypothetical protein
MVTRRAGPVIKTGVDVQYQIWYYLGEKEMTKKAKREQNIRDNTRNVSLVDFEWLIKSYGVIEAGHHHAKAIINGHSFPYPRENPIKHTYVERILEIIDEMKKGG